MRIFMTATCLASLAWSSAAIGQSMFVAKIDFASIERCSEKSPEIVVQNVPNETVLFEVSLQDYDAPGYRHGGGKAANDGTGIIKQGSVKGNYEGPCPPFPHRYNFTITARDAGGKKLGETEVKGTYPVPTR